VPPPDLGAAEQPERLGWVLGFFRVSTTGCWCSIAYTAAAAATATDDDDDDDDGGDGEAVNV